MANAVGFEGADTVFRAPKGKEDRVHDLECFMPDDRSEIVSCWRLTEAKLAEVATTGVVWLHIMGGGMPPVYVSGEALVQINGRPAKAEPIIPRRVAHDQ